jgi:hypothetical protein
MFVQEFLAEICIRDATSSGFSTTRPAEYSALLILGPPSTRRSILSRISIETSQSAEACYACFIILKHKQQIILNRVRQKLFLQLKSQFKQ